MTLRWFTGSDRPTQRDSAVKALRGYEEHGLSEDCQAVAHEPGERERGDRQAEFGDQSAIMTLTLVSVTSVASPGIFPVALRFNVKSSLAENAGSTSTISSPSD
jgi:hypothetical protein